MSDAPWRRIAHEVEAAASPGGRARLGCCALEGTRLFERALRAGARIEAALVRPGFREASPARHGALLDALAAAGCRLEQVPAEVLERLTGGRDLGGVIGLAALPAAPTLDALLERAATDVGLARPTLLVGCVGFDDPGNVGAVARTAHAGGAAALVAVACTDAFHPRALRASKGSLFRLPVLRAASVGELVAAARAHGFWSVGALARGGVPPGELALDDRPRLLLLGSEAHGLAAADEALLDARVSIPMAPGVDSYSVNAAAAVLVHALGWGAGGRG